MAERLTKETAVVYRANGRRWFTLDAACRAEGRALLAGWFRAARAEWENIPDHLMVRYWRAVAYLATRAKRRSTSARQALRTSEGGKDA